MSAYLLRRARRSRGLAGRINRGFDRLKAIYARHLDVALQQRRPIYAAWAVVSVLAVLMFTQAPRSSRRPRTRASSSAS